ncbi:hypothetical protein [Helicobacter winghamensis]|uniref:Uncharacterized protein n=1 Tax=Helicobacter winghamensis TaxID=157268 RepID=A0A2N3PJA3_9HELI|nr:hypothetical protein [Helicobacter winghamensis]EEO25438.1 hypothetical protein HWAG_00230 [Helicobacter winghamensis ATCC BAA-430]PKT78132.1 hypothetical protein BCM34_02690 [Helicobacter winghamensis]PKT78401.1 hypothetical protein BCM32_01460 [Helicobacter winghamensis]PKT78661.1 hypothetical protein BCM35_00980 [Helicobacter winghamensis]PKT80432.1 hypothetical protein BCM33_07880 [Helicobacter winghamensis]
MFDLFLVLLQVLFIGLKLANKIQWSWWLVLLPMIIYIFLYLFLFVLVGGFLFGLGISLMEF